MEDCGGAPGHLELTSALANPDDADPDMLAWAGDYDPECFDLSTLNHLLQDWATERRRQIQNGIAWRRSSLLWRLFRHRTPTSWPPGGHDGQTAYPATEKNVMETPAITPGSYRHFKGKPYRVIGIARHSETQEDMVVYQALYGERGWWVRPLAMFAQQVEHEGKLVLRFERVGK